MILMQPPSPVGPAILAAPVVAYVNETQSLEGQLSLRGQILAVVRRARRDGVAIGLLVIESDGRRTASGRGERLEAVLDVARLDGLPRVLYVAHPRHLADAPGAELVALGAVDDAGFELRAPCGRISPNGRRAAALRAALGLPPRRRRAASRIDVSDP